jgi:hypothetical protein
MDDVDDGTVIAALVSTLFSIFGLILVVYPKWLGMWSLTRISKDA